MRLIIEARLEGGKTSETEATTVAVVERKDRSVADLGLTLAEGRALLAEVQSLLVSEQTAGWMESQLACHRCGSMLAHKDARSIALRTVFGKVKVPSPRLWTCSCAAKPGQPRRSVSPLCKAVRQRVTPELEYLQARWAAHLPYRQATELLREVLPLDKGISFGSTRRRILTVGSALDAQIERDIASGPKVESTVQVRESTTVGCVSVDSAWLRFSSSPRSRKAARDLAELKSPWAQKLTQDRHVNVVAGRATLADHTPRLFAYVHKMVPSAPARLDQFLFESGVGQDERVTVISDDAGEFCKAVDGSQLARARILDWFHIAMKFKAARSSVFGNKTIEPDDRIAVETAIDHAKWLVWHGRGQQSVFRIKTLDATLMVNDGYEYSTLYWNLRRLFFYIENNAGALVNYGMRYHKGQPISSSIAESAVNLVVSHRMAKKQQMRWTDKGAHYLALVRVAVLNEEFSVERLAELARASVAANSPNAHRAA
ncbi:ISKra4 family transposase ISBte1 [Paraburkholderia nemoris]|uniref:ISKra4 family transposase n=1 Tax=Paraburkholderia nemoris TaxID=2793076 RepID=UPI00190A1343|nr:MULTISPECIES: ISKra4 family transposase [Paraburkholderia]MBK3786016.1 ISKra4 family transposase [Paraburkholderia aspalathi]CAE6843540.1 ISKra4 family transposase ISBte1 [Paraburkholderia nemoris]